MRAFHACVEFSDFVNLEYGAPVNASTLSLIFMATSAVNEQSPLRQTRNRGQTTVLDFSDLSVGFEPRLTRRSPLAETASKVPKCGEWKVPLTEKGGHPRAVCDKGPALRNCGTADMHGWTWEPRTLRRMKYWPG
jgi:hypothetical protein